MDEAKCPVMHGAVARNSGGGTSNREWWPNQLNLNICISMTRNPARLIRISITVRRFQSLIMRR